MGRRTKIRVSVGDTVETKLGEKGILKSLVSLPKTSRGRAADFATVEFSGSDSKAVTYEPRSLKKVAAA
jgi:hypothetical protein